MNAARMACIALLFALPVWSNATALKLSDYQLDDGAIVLKRDEPFVDPYFSTKALLIAAQHGLQVNEVARKWVNWLLPRQLADGRFMRFCKQTMASRDWAACHEADADDAMMAMWLALIAETMQDPLPKNILESIERSLKQLEKLRVADSGVYLVSETNKVALLMDNVEIYEGYRALSRHFQKRGDAARAKRYAARASALAAAIERVFWSPAQQRYRITTQTREANDFYPDRLAQLYPLLGDLPDVRNNRAAVYRDWLQANRGNWLALSADEFPWGLVAIAALRMGDLNTAANWNAIAGSLRGSQRWNVLEEAIYEVVDACSVTTAGAASC